MSFETWQWLFPVAVTIHNSEEAIFMPRWIAANPARVPLHPGAGRVRLALLVLTLAAFVLTCLSARYGKGSIPAYLLFGYITAMLANVVIPHIPASLVFREYTPGLVTAVVVNLPVMAVLFFLALREQWVEGMKAVAYGTLVPIAITAIGLGLLAADD